MGLVARLVANQVTEMSTFFSRLGKVLVLLLLFLAAAIGFGVFMFAAMRGLCWLWGGCI